VNITFYDGMGASWTFLHVPKTAGKSISAYIMKHSTNAKTLHTSSHATLKEMQSLGANLGTTFAVFRNPYSRAVSLYRFLFEVDIRAVTAETTNYFHKTPDFSWHNTLLKEHGQLTFEQFCKKLPWMPLGVEQHHYLPVGKILRMENLETEFKFIQTMLNTQEPLYKFNSTNNSNWQRYYTKQTQEIIAETYCEDFKLLNYSKDINNSSI
jgi:hypothetical protein